MLELFIMNCENFGNQAPAEVGDPKKMLGVPL